MLFDIISLLVNYLASTQCVLYCGLAGLCFSRPKCQQTVLGRQCPPPEVFGYLAIVAMPAPQTYSTINIANLILRPERRKPLADSTVMKQAKELRGMNEQQRNEYILRMAHVSPTGLSQVLIKERALLKQAKKQYLRLQRQIYGKRLKPLTNKDLASRRKKLHKAALEARRGVDEIVMWHEHYYTSVTAEYYATRPRADNRVKPGVVYAVTDAGVCFEAN